MIKATKIQRDQPIRLISDSAIDQTAKTPNISPNIAGGLAGGLHRIESPEFRHESEMAAVKNIMS